MCIFVQGTTGGCFADLQHFNKDIRLLPKNSDLWHYILINIFRIADHIYLFQVRIFRTEDGIYNSIKHIKQIDLSVVPGY